MPRDDHLRPAAGCPQPAAGSGPYWRALLEARWRARLRELTELSLAYHASEAQGGRGDETLLGRAVAARWKLADVEEALGRLTTGGFGRCEQCGSAIPARLLAVTPEARYCPRCDREPVHAVSGRSLR